MRDGAGTSGSCVVGTVSKGPADSQALLLSPLAPRRRQGWPDSKQEPANKHAGWAAVKQQHRWHTHDERRLPRNAQAAVEGGEQLAGTQHDGGGAGQCNRRAQQALCCCVPDSAGLMLDCSGHWVNRQLESRAEEEQRYAARRTSGWRRLCARQSKEPARRPENWSPLPSFDPAKKDPATRAVTFSFANRCGGLAFPAPSCSRTTEESSYLMPKVFRSVSQAPLILKEPKASRRTGQR